MRNRFIMKVTLLSLMKTGCSFNIYDNIDAIFVDEKYLHIFRDQGTNVTIPMDDVRDFEFCHN